MSCKQIVLAGGHQDDGPDWYRIQMPARWLADQGHAVRRVYGQLNQEAVAGADVVMVQRGWHPLLVLALDVLRHWKMRTAYELDDDVWAIPDWNPLKAAFAPEQLRGMENCMRLSDAVIVTTHQLAQLVAQYNPNVYVVPNAIDLSLVPPPLPRSKPGVRIGWAGSHTHAADLQMMVPALRRVMKARPEVTAVFLGAMPPAWKPTEPRTEWVSWVNPKALYAQYQALQLDIALAPIVPCRFNECKSPVKVLEAAAIGVPVVATDFGPYRCVLQGTTGLKVADNDQDEWEQALIHLIDDADERVAMGARARGWVESVGTFDRAGPKWRKALGIESPLPVPSGIEVAEVTA
jgi:glycosyltransferase involved in cell wall biosynthesis